jgi:hypothetical protein
MGKSITFPYFRAVIADQRSFFHPVLRADSPLTLQVVRKVMV